LVKQEVILAKNRRITTHFKEWQHPTGNLPERVALVALGPSCSEYLNTMVATGPGVVCTDENGNDPRPPDEVWTVNTGMRAYPHDVCFGMDDLRMTEACWPDLAQMVQQSKTPFITSVAYDNYPSNVLTYPLGEVLSVVGPQHAYLNNTVPFILAYAIALGSVKVLQLYGCDYTYPGMAAREEGRGCVEFWIGGMRMAYGIDVRVAQSSSLTDAMTGRPLYGYLFPPKIEVTAKTKKGKKNA
jgi:hypothetical protein